MRKLWFVLVALAPLAVSGAVQSYRLTWDPLPADQTVVGECRVNAAPFAVIGEAPGDSAITFALNVNPGDRIECRALARKAGFPDSPYSEVATSTVPLVPPAGVRVAPQ